LLTLRKNVLFSSAHPSPLVAFTKASEAQLKTLKDSSEKSSSELKITKTNSKKHLTINFEQI